MPKNNAKPEQQQRLQAANEFIKAIASCGRHFFGSTSPDQVATLSLDDRGLVWLLDEYSGKRINTHRTGVRWKGFSHGGTLKDLVMALRDFIKKGETLSFRYFTPAAPDAVGGNPWGYGQDLLIVRDAGVRLQIVKQPAEPTP